MIKKLIVISNLLVVLIYSQDVNTSLAFKKNRIVLTNPIFNRPEPSYQIIQQFKLIQQANAGDAIAQHELGLRLLSGEGFLPDTSAAIKWIYKAAQQNLTVAQHNYAIMLFNGIGVDWNPFEAFKYFKKSAIENFAPAQYILGILYTENLLVPQNFRLAFYWISKALENGYSVDTNFIKFLESKTPQSFRDSIKFNLVQSYVQIKNKIDTLTYRQSSNSNLSDQSFELSFIDFDSENINYNYIDEQRLVEEILQIDLLKDSSYSNIKSINELVKLFGIEEFYNLSKYDIPEILTLMGYLYFRGEVFQKNEIKAAEYFILAIKYDSRISTFLLLELIKNKTFLHTLKNQLKQNNNTARFVWYGLARFGFFKDIILNDAYDLLKLSAENNYISSLNELALNYYLGNYFKKNIEKAINIWKLSEDLGSQQATIRLLLTQVFDESNKLDQNIFNALINFQSKGSILAQIALGFCYEKGRGTSVNKALAVKYYRKAAQRGNRFAYDRLLNMYNQIRPQLSEFKIE